MSETDAVIKNLRACARRQKAAEAKAAEARAEIDALVLAGHDLGMAKLVLAREAGLTRQTVYTILLKAGRS